MKVTRLAVFESTSSSSHSISFSTGIPSRVDMLPRSDDGYHISTGEFGWGPETHTDAVTKASYCLTYAKNKPDKLEMLRNTLEAEGFNPLHFDGVESEDGYIDHQSDDVGESAFSSSSKLLRFIFDPQSRLVIDNDNH
jgi:hypothetical protein